jgi:hypothetical protein
MRLFVTSDSSKESGVGEVVYEIGGATFEHFHNRNYGPDLNRIAVILMCRNPAMKFKRRIRFARKDKILYMDVMLSPEEMCALSRDSRKKIIAERLAEEIPAVVRKYKLPGFNLERFADDLKGFLADWPKLKVRGAIL